jgi:hypothetical protein
MISLAEMLQGLNAVGLLRKTIFAHHHRQVDPGDLS